MMLFGQFHYVFIAPDRFFVHKIFLVLFQFLKIFSSNRSYCFSKILITITIVKIHSILLSVANTSLPILSSTGIVRPGARNFNHDSIKLIEQIKSAHKNTAIITINKPVIILNSLMVCFCNTLFWIQTFVPFYRHAILHRLLFHR